jgi:predicted nucleic acid-binding protein
MVDVETVLRVIGLCPVRPSPIVAGELLRGTAARSRRAVEDLIAKQLPIEPPSWRRAWLDAGRLLPAVFSDHEDVGLSRLQNDCLWALTARRTGALFVTADRHFEAIRRRLPFPLKILQA